MSKTLTKKLLSLSILTILSITLLLSKIELTNQQEDDGLVNILTDDNFNDFIKENKYVFVKFYAPWCGHCKKMAGDLKDAAEELQYTEYKIAKLDATVHTKIAGEVGVSGYPTLKFYIDGKMKNYTGGRTKSEIVEWIKNRVEKHENQENTRVEGEPEKEDDVYILTDDNLDSFVKANPYVFVEFYAPWCGHCKKMMPALHTAAERLSSERADIKIAKLDATVHKEAAKKVGLKGYPTLRFYYNGNMVEYNGGREENDLVTWLTKKSGDPTKDLTTVEEIEAFKKESDVAIVYFGTKETEMFKSFAVSYDHAVFATCSNEALYKEYKVKAGTVVLFKNFDEGRNELPGVYSIPTMKTFVENRSIPSLITYEEKYQRIIYGELPSILFFYDFSSQKAEIFDDVMLDLAKRVKGRVLVVKSDITSKDQKAFADELGVSAEIMPIILLLNPKDGKKYIMKAKKINSNTIRKFINDWQNGNAEVFIKSEEVPEYQNSPVITVVGKTFDQIVKDPTKDVLIEFYAPWCGHCQKLAPVYEELARTLSNNTNLVIAKMDATKNESDVPVSGYPTIKFFPANNKQPIDYKRSENDNIDAFVEFIKKHATHPISSGFELIDEDEEEEKPDL